MMKHGDSSLTQCHRGDSALRAEFANTQLCGGGGRQTERQVDRWSSGSVRGSPSALLQRPECCDSDLLSSYSPLRLCALTHQLSKWRGITKTLRISVSTPPPPPPCLKSAPEWRLFSVKIGARLHRISQVSPVTISTKWWTFCSTIWLLFMPSFHVSVVTHAFIQVFLIIV